MRDGVGGEPHTVTTIVLDGERSASIHQSGMDGSVPVPSPNGRFMMTRPGPWYGNSPRTDPPQRAPRRRSSSPPAVRARLVLQMRSTSRPWDQFGAHQFLPEGGSEQPFAQLADVEGVSNEQIAYGKNRDTLSPDRRISSFPTRSWSPRSPAAKTG